MIIDFNKIEEQSIPNFKGGEKSLEARMYFDGTNRVLKGRLQPGASIGLHTHDDSCEMIFLTRGTPLLYRISGFFRLEITVPGDSYMMGKRKW